MVNLVVEDPFFHILELFGFLDYEFVMLSFLMKFLISYYAC